ncbi:hypothetical protein GYMLUDRAFT_383464 [Collybiopsis luxurians FD-317 M1]|nr:hypothetical protein GYMLUDRAFT_383464 [Collybiopsis luxurians FD-317 M1]
MSSCVNYSLINYEFQILADGAIFDIDIEDHSPQIKSRYAEAFLLNQLRQEYQWSALDSPKPLKLFNLASYDLLVEFGDLTNQIKPVIAFLDKHSVPMPSFWGKSMYLVVMVKGSYVIDFAKCKDPLLNPHPSALQCPASATPTFTLMDLELNKI